MIYLINGFQDLLQVARLSRVARFMETMTGETDTLFLQ
jgi:hypothetical protein